MHGLHNRSRRRVGRHMFMRRHHQMMAAMGRGPRFDHGLHGGWEPTAPEQIRWLEEYRRDLEQEAADVASRIAELRSRGDEPDA